MYVCIIYTYMYIYANSTHNLFDNRGHEANKHNLFLILFEISFYNYSSTVSMGMVF